MSSIWALFVEYIDVLALLVSAVALCGVYIQLAGERKARQLQSAVALFDIADRHWARLNEATHSKYAQPDNPRFISQYRFEFGQLLSTLELLALALNRRMADAPVSDFYKIYLRNVLETLLEREEDCQQIAMSVTDSDTFFEVRKFIASEPNYCTYKAEAMNIFSGIEPDTSDQRDNSDV